jgi:hypothetical protein
MSNSDARQQALEVHDAFEVEPTSLISYRSRGSILAFGDPAALARCADLPPGLEIQQASTDGCRVLIEGYLGAYAASVTDAEGNIVKYRGDAILDLGETPLLAREMLPPGTR